MALNAGTQLGQYEVLGLLGKGGMGEVYRARDSKLAREVALKVLPAPFAQSPERVARFRREAQLLASLNHPNIAAIHGLEDSDGLNFLVLELVLGETLAQRISAAGPLPIEEALGLSKQIAEALEAAHDKGVIHRDLKPANIKITPEGKIKVLDFGLAKAYAGEEPSGDPTVSPTQAPTLSAAATAQGMILGTAAYMSPEQARGKKVDKRTDIWAFGAVLYEMLTGRQAFEGENVTEILAAVLKAEPDWNILPATTPPAIRTLLRRCLQKDASRRFHHAADLRIEIEDALAASASALSAPVAQIPARGPQRWMLLSALACLVAAAIAGIAVWKLRPASGLQERPVTRLVMALASAEDRLAVGLNEPSVALSPDGTHLAYITNRGGIQQLFVRDMGSSEASPIRGTEGAEGPFFSPDGKWIGFFAGGQLKKVPVSGGATLTLVGAANPRGASWGPDDTIFFAPTTGSAISKVPAAGGTPQPVTKLDKGESAHRWPQVVPGGKALLFNVSTGSPDDWPIVAQSLETGERRELVQGGRNPRYSPSGHLVYYRAGTLMAVPFDPVRLEVKGTPAPALEGIMSTGGNSGGAHFTFSEVGSLVYAGGGPQTLERSLVWVDRRGAAQPLGAPSRAYSQPQLSPDGRQLALTIQEPKSDIWVYDIPRGTLTRLTFEGSSARPLWTPDGKRVAFAGTRRVVNLFWKLADGTGPEEQITKSEHFFLPSSISRDGKLAFYVESDPKNFKDLWTVQLDGEHKAAPFLQTPFDETVPLISPDGRWVSYVSSESGRSEIYVRAFPGPGGKWQISTDGGLGAVWARNGRELFYLSGDKIMAVDVNQSRDSNGAVASGFSAGTPRLLFEGVYEKQAGAGANYDVSPDGQRFLMIKGSGTQTALTQLNVVLEWFEELKGRVPVK